MKKMILNFFVALSLYSVVPTPKVEWTKQNMQYALCFLPLIGLLIGALEFAWFTAAKYWRLEGTLYSAGAVLLPILVTGGIHIDGFIDTSDAICSYGDKEKRLEIMRDPHVGAFGIVYVAALFLLQYGLFCQIYSASKGVTVLWTGYALARTIGGAAIVLLPCAKNSGLAHLFSGASNRKIVGIVLLVQYVLCILWVSIHQFLMGIALLVLLLIFSLRYRRFCHTAFGGMTGDTAGFAITIIETLVMLLAAVSGLILR